MSSATEKPSCAEIVGHNGDLIIHISIFLPVKSILRFRSVSKQWYSLLTHPHFMLSYKPKNSMFFLQTPLQPGSTIFDSLYLNENHDNFDGIVNFNHLRNSSGDILSLEGSCNGLLLVLLKSPEIKDVRKHRYYVCNPSTRKHSELVVPVIIATTATTICGYLAFDPCTSPYYKVIFFWNDGVNPCKNHISIFSSESRTWRTLGHTFDRVSNQLLGTGLFFNGSICWIELPYRAKQTLNYFDVNEESINVFSDPPNFGPHDYVLYFGAFRGHLNLIILDMRKPLQGDLNVYELKDDYSSWVARYKVDITSISLDFPRIIKSKDEYEYNVLFVLEKEEEQPALVLCVGNDLLAYNLIDNTTKKLCHLPSSSIYHTSTRREELEIEWCEAFLCYESLYGV